MKFTNRNNALHLLEASPLFVLGEHMSEPTSKPDISMVVYAGNKDSHSIAAAELMQQQFTERCPLFSERIQYITEPFFSAYEIAREKFDKMPEGETVEQQGTFIRNIGRNQTHTVFYQVKAVLREGNWLMNGNIAFILTSKELEFPMLAFYTDVSNSNGISYLSAALAAEGGTPNHYVADVLSMLLFLKYCPLETKIIDAGKKENHIRIKYLNDTKSPIEILDSTWFTTIVRSDGFVVGEKHGGFFRWQRSGPGLSKWDFKFIPAFQKHGYNRKAKILKEP